MYSTTWNLFMTPLCYSVVTKSLVYRMKYWLMFLMFTENASCKIEIVLVLAYVS